jgi:hypothetical protein
MSNIDLSISNGMALAVDIVFVEADFGHRCSHVASSASKDVTKGAKNGGHPVYREYSHTV